MLAVLPEPSPLSPGTLASLSLAALCRSGGPLGSGAGAISASSAS